VEGILSELPPGCRIHVDHINYRSVDEFVERLNRYTTQEARLLADRGQAWSAEAMLQDALKQLEARYEPQKDGAHSLILAGMMAFYRFTAWVKLWEASGCPDGRVPRDLAQLSQLARQAWSAPVPPEPGGPCWIAQTDSRGPAGCELKGFFEDEGGWRWMGPVGNIRVPAERRRSPVQLSFKLNCVDAEKYRDFPFTARIVSEGERRVQFSFSNAWQNVLVQVPLSGRDRPADIRIECPGGFVVAGDSRPLSLMLSGLSLARLNCRGF
jgi:hypothetical protein